MNHRPYPNRDDANRAARENEIEQDRRAHVARCADTPKAGCGTVSDTPRTDAAAGYIGWDSSFQKSDIPNTGTVVEIDFAKGLERDNARLEKQASSYAAQTCLAITRADEAEFQRKKVERENAALREAGKALRNALAFECQKLGDRPREIDAWDVLTKQLKP